MRYLVDLAFRIIKEFWRSKWRFFLAIFCVAWGTMTVILLASLADGFYRTSEKDVMIIAEGGLTLVPDRTTMPFEGYQSGRKIKIKASDVVDLPKKLAGVAAVSPLLSTYGNVSYADKKSGKSIYGVCVDFAKIHRIFLTKNSRYINEYDINTASHVAIIGDNLQDYLFGKSGAIGREILINGIPFAVIGVIDTKKTIYAQYSNAAIIPYTAHISLWGNQDVSTVMVLANQEPEYVARNLRNFFAYEYHFNVLDTGALKIYSSAKFLGFMQQFFGGIKMFLLACGLLTLAVSSFGVANIMFLIVTEKTREIGIRKALGASRRQILQQILLETLVVVFVGGFLGFILADAIILILQYTDLPSWLGKPFISLVTAVITVFFLTLCGVAAGYFPARRAARLDPVLAIGRRKNI